MRARHRHKNHGGACGPRARGGGVGHRPHNVIKGEGAAPKLHAGKRARGGSTTRKPKPKPEPSPYPTPLPDMPGPLEAGPGGAEEPGIKRGGGIHIKKSHEGLLHKNLGVPAGKKIPAGKLEKAKHSSDEAVRKRAVFAENAKHWHH